ncbi:MAG TPA: hypothetical protein DCY75_04445, partial [Clostridiales bacterium]|nr:hypothetical protein [Clostridiales bacterium]
GYLDAYDTRVVWTTGIMILLVCICIVWVFWFFQSSFFALLASEFVGSLLGQFTHIHCFLVKRKKNKVFMSEAMANYFEFPSREMSIAAFDRFLFSATDGAVSGVDTSRASTVFVTPVTGVIYYVRYACHPFWFNSYRGYISHITGAVPGHASLYNPSPKEYQTGLETYQNLIENLIDNAPHTKGKILFMTMFLGVNLSGFSMYDVDFEAKCQRMLVDILKNTFQNSAMYFVTKGEYILVLYGIKTEEALHGAMEEVKEITSRIYPVGDESVSFETKLGVFCEYAGVIRTVGQSREVLNKLMFCMMKLKQGKDGNPYEFSSYAYRQHLDRLLRTRYLPAIFREEQIRLVFQPIVSLENGKTVMYEVLVRSTHEVYPNPDMLIKDCMSQGLDKELDMLIYKKFRCMLESGELPMANFTVNILGNTPMNDDLLWIADLLHDNGYCLYLEMVEHMKIADDLLEDRILQAKKHHIRLVADDYGQNAANLDTLYKVNFDVLKIPMEFTTRLDRNRKNRSFVSNIIHYCKECNVYSIAEGVENEAELQILKEMRVDYVQGYYFSRPMSTVPAEPVVYDIGRQGS